MFKGFVIMTFFAQSKGLVSYAVIPSVEVSLKIYWY